MAAGRGRQGEDWLIDQNHFGTQTKAFSFAPPFKNHWDADAGETMGGQSCCPRAPLCMAVSPWENTVGWPGRVHGGPVGGVEVRARGGLCVGKAKIIGCPYQTDCHPSTQNLDSTPWPVAWVMQHRHAAYKNHLDTRQDGFARQGWSPDRMQRRGEGP